MSEHHVEHDQPNPRSLDSEKVSDVDLHIIMAVTDNGIDSRTRHAGAAITSCTSTATAV